MKFPLQTRAVWRHAHHRKSWTAAGILASKKKDKGSPPSDQPLDPIPNTPTAACDANNGHITCGEGCCDSTQSYCSTIVDSNDNKIPQCIQFPKDAGGHFVLPDGESFCFKVVKPGDQLTPGAKSKFVDMFCMMTPQQ
jgi:hypothetical protein